MTVEVPHPLSGVSPSDPPTKSATAPAEDTVVARVYIVRHGETDENRAGIMQGHLDTVLNAAGVEQARLAADALEDVPFEVAWTSDLQRARKTAEVILEKHPGVRLEESEALRERFMGDWQGKNIIGRPEPANLEPTADFVARGAKWWNNEGVLRHVQRHAAQLKLLAATTTHPKPPPPSESATELDPEADAAFEPLHILVVSHGGMIDSLVANLLGSRRLRAAEGVVITRCFNASISVVELYPNGKGVLVSYADTTHLSVEELVQDNADEQ